jgi:hypothetical protein
MIFNPRSIFSAALVSLCVFEAAAIDLKPILDPSELTSGHASKRDVPEGLTLVPIDDPGVLTHGRSLRRESPGNGVFDPKSVNSFFWGAYAGNTIYTANFTLFNPDPDEFILAIEHFAKKLKSINCGSTSEPMTIEFNDKDSYSYAQSAWNWVNQEDDNKFTLVTKPNQCYEGDDRSPYLVSDIAFDESKLVAKLFAKERPWGEIAHSFRLTLNHEIIDPDAANITHPHLMHMKRDTKTLDISTSFNQNLFKYSKDTTGGLDVTADATISTGGQIIADLDIEYKWFIPTDLKINIRPSGVNAQFLLALQADGKLGSAIDWTLKPSIEIPVGALNIKGILEIGPFVTMGVHFGSSALEGTARAQVGAKATIDDSATVDVKIRHPDDNSISGWTPHFERIEPSFTASISGNVRAWAELGIQIKAEALGRWGYQASVDAQLPYFEASFAARADSVNGVCGTTSPFGVDLSADVGINVNLNAGEVDEAPKFKKDLFETKWNLFSTCIGIGGEGAATGAPASNTALPTVAPTSAVVESTLTPTPTDIVPTPESSVVVEPPAPTSSIVADTSVVSSVVVDLPTITVSPSPVSSVVETSVVSSDVVAPTDASSSVVVVEPSTSHVEEESSAVPTTHPAASTDISTPLPTHVESSTIYDIPTPYPVSSSSSSNVYYNSSAPILPTSVEYPVYTSSAAPTSTHAPAYGGHDGGYEDPEPTKKPSKKHTSTSSKPCTSSTLKSVVKPKYTTSTPAPYKSSTPVPYKSSTPVPYKSSTPAPYKSSTPVPYKSSTPVPYKSSTPAPYKSSTPAPYKSSTPAPYKSSTPAPYKSSTPAPYKPAPTSSAPPHYASSSSSPAPYAPVYSSSAPPHYDPPAPSSSSPAPYAPAPVSSSPAPYAPAPVSTSSAAAYDPPAPSSSSPAPYAPAPVPSSSSAVYTPDPPAYTPPAPPAYTPPAPPAYTPDPPAYTAPAPPAYVPAPPSYGRPPTPYRPRPVRPGYGDRGGGRSGSHY